MRVVTERWPLDLLPPTRMLKFSKAEQAALRRAAAIADQARELWAQSLGGSLQAGTLDGEPLDTELALICMGVTEVVDGIDVTP